MFRISRLAVPAIVTAAVAAGFMLPPGSNAQSNPQEIVKERQELMKTMGKSFGPILAVSKGESTDFAAAGMAAQTISDSITKAAQMFPEGTAVGEVEGSRAKPEVWSDSAEFEKAAKALAEATAKLATIAQSENLEAFNAQLPVVGQTCGGCHEGKGSAGGKFRVASES